MVENKMIKKKSLGRGLDALLGGSKINSTNDETNGSPLMVPIEQILPNPDQPRQDFNEKELKYLALSIENKGIIEPLIVL